MAWHRELATACLRPSWITLGTAGLVLVGFFVCVLLLTPQSLHAALGIYPGYRTLDDRYFLFHRLTKLHEPATPREGLGVVVLGASTARESIWDEKSLASRISERIGKPVHAVELTSGGQTMIQSWSLAEQTLCHGFDVAVVATTLGRFAREDFGDPAEDFGYRASSTDAFVGVEASPDAPYAVDNLGFVSKSLFLVPHLALYDLVGISRFKDNEKNAEVRHRFIGKKASQHSTVKKRLRLATESYLYWYPRKVGANMKMLERLIETAHACGGTVVLFETPLHPWLLENPEFAKFQKLFRQHQAAITAIAEKYGLAYIELNRRIAYTAQDSNDHGHLRLESTIRATTTAIADGVADYILSRPDEGQGGLAQWQRTEP